MLPLTARWRRAGVSMGGADVGWAVRSSSAPNGVASVGLDTPRSTHDNEATYALMGVDRGDPGRLVAEMLGAEHTMASALDSITVLDLSDSPAGALATMFLCDHGARVIRVVDIHDTAPRRGGYLVWDRGKECIRLALAR